MFVCREIFLALSLDIFVKNNAAGVAKTSLSSLKTIIENQFFITVSICSYDAKLPAEIDLMSIPSVNATSEFNEPSCLLTYLLTKAN